MKTVVVDRDLLEHSIKPHPLMAEYRRLLKEEVHASLASGTGLSPATCPGCGQGDVTDAFEKSGLRYVECVRCRTVYVNPRPSEAALDHFNLKSRAFEYWRARIFEDTREARRAKIARPRARWTLEAIDRYCPGAGHAVVAGYHSRLLVEELVEQGGAEYDIVVSNPLAGVEFRQARWANVEIRSERLMASVAERSVPVIVAFDLLDRCADLDAFLRRARHVLSEGGLLLASAMLITGFELQVLWDRAETIYPPERFNLLSAEGLALAAERHRFEVLEFSTPGMLDVEAVRAGIRAEPEAPWPRFIRYVIEQRDETALAALQDYLQEFRLSSFGRVVLRKGA